MCLFLLLQTLLSIQLEKAKKAEKARKAEKAENVDEGV